MKKIITINALVWAAVLIGSAILFRENPNFPYFLLGAVLAFAIVHGLLQQNLGKHRNCPKD